MKNGSKKRYEKEDFRNINKKNQEFQTLVRNKTTDFRILNRNFKFDILTLQAKTKLI